MITQTLAGFVATTPPETIPSATLHMLRLSFLDWMAVGTAGAQEPVAQITRGLALQEQGTPQSHVFGDNICVPARAAALVNGATSHALDYDDTHFAHIGHPSVAVISAALAMAERQSTSGCDLQVAALIGMETSIRIGMWLGRDHYQAGFHQTGTAGAFGAAAAAARILGFDTQHTAMALGLVATRASGLKSQFGTMGKPYNAGIAAANGVEAALLVQGGFQANALGLDTAQGFGDTHFGQADMSALDGLGADWLFDGISHKFHACCHGLHATLEALAKVPDMSPENIDSIVVQTHPRWMTVCNQQAPDTGLEAKFSYRMVVAMALMGHATAALDSYADALCRDPEIVALRECVSVVTAPTLTEMQAQLEITLTNGTVHTVFHDLDAPMSQSARTVRVTQKSVGLISQSATDRNWALLTHDASASDLGAALNT